MHHVRSGENMRVKHATLTLLLLAASADSSLGSTAEAASALPRLKFCIFFNFKTLLVLQFVIKFANIWAQYCPLTYASTHIGFFDLCPNVQMAALTHWK